MHASAHMWSLLPLIYEALLINHTRPLTQPRISCIFNTLNILIVVNKYDYVSNRLLIIGHSCKFEGDVTLFKVTGILTIIKACSIIYRLWRNVKCLIIMFIWSIQAVTKWNKLKCFIFLISCEAGAYCTFVLVFGILQISIFAGCDVIDSAVHVSDGRVKTQSENLYTL